MKKIDFNYDWYYKHLQENDKNKKVTLPHDAMLSERRSQESLGAGNIGWFEGSDYVYTKYFFIPEDYNHKTVIFEFEGVYHNAEVYLNGKKAAYRPYGYTNFYVNADQFLIPGAENEIRVIARNTDQPNSRWYTGSGIYRPVSMYVAEKRHILVNGVKIRTISHSPARLEIDIHTSDPGEVNIEILNGNQVVTSLQAKTEGKVTLATEIPKAKLWSPEAPNLYTCRVTYEEDEAQEAFGIRLLNWNSKKGLTINGERVILRGACIHHDNGLLGACAYPEAEERKIRILKENGYNAVRSAHNPCSKALLHACDRLGMLVMDEYVDVWYIHKTEYDYAGYMSEWWQADLKDMVEKDYNHPSVIMYSTGNEVSETAQKRGITLTGEMTAYLHELDATRPVSCGVNIFFNFLSSIGFGVYSDKKAKKNAEKAARDGEIIRSGRKKKKPVGSEFYNTLAGIFGDYTMKLGATLYPCDVKTRDAFANMDIAGYNYGILRYKHDLKKYPNRLILGSETFCKDAYSFWEFAKKNPRIIGDFVWAGMDYMGEAGIGAWEYEDYAPADADMSGWLTAGSGRINIVGKPMGEAAYTKVAFEQTDQPAIAVKPVYQKGKHSPSAWKMTDAMESWSWQGCDGNKAEVEVYARGAEVELLLNGSSLGRKKLKNYDSSIVEKLNLDHTKRTVNRVTMEWKMAIDTDGAGTIDPRLLGDLKRMKDKRQTDEDNINDISITEQRKQMGGINYNLNTIQIYTRYIEVDTTCGRVPVWMYYPRYMEEQRPMLLYVHGGAFFGGSVFNVENGCRLLAERANCVVCNIDYSLPPETPYPIPTTQIYEVLSYLHKNAKNYNMDSNYMFIGGDSAGGNMSAVAAQMDRDRKTGFLRGEVLIYAKLTFSNHLLKGYQRNLDSFELAEDQQEYLPMLTAIGSDISNAKDEQVYVQGKYDITNPYISPAFGKKEGLPKTLMIQAEYDGLRLEGEFYANQLQEAGVPVKMVCYRNVTHGFIDKIGILPQAEAAIDEIAKFILEDWRY